MQQRALAHTGRADDGHHLAALDLRSRSRSTCRRWRSDLIRLVEVGGGEEGHALTRDLMNQGSGDPGSPSSLDPEIPEFPRSVAILAAFHLIVDSRRAAADGRARKRAFLTAHQRARDQRPHRPSRQSTARSSATCAAAVLQTRRHAASKPDAPSAGRPARSVTYCVWTGYAP